MVDISAVRRIILIQLAVTLAVALMILLIQGVIAAVSSFAGGAIGFLSSLVYAIKMLPTPGSDAKKILHAQYGAEAYKLIFTILLFSLVYTQFKELQVLPMLATYVATLTVYWFALIFVKK